GSRLKELSLVSDREFKGKKEISRGYFEMRVAAAGGPGHRNAGARKGQNPVGPEALFQVGNCGIVDDIKGAIGAIEG
ncbi:MAG: hypothetical protein AABZ46_04825, partial [Nitrospirota bacterium]